MSLCRWIRTLRAPVFFHRLLDVSGHGSQSGFPTESEVSGAEATPFASARHVGVVLADDEACNTLFFDEGTCNTLFFNEGERV